MASRRERATPSYYDARIGSGGRLVIPIDLRRELGLEAGTDVRLNATSEGVLEVKTPLAGVRAARAIVRRHVKPGAGSVVDELIRERRAEAERESAE
jgi:bifunctional DNA-binding transcriptional regulator/antitoxin component of YhaV-PrlF toxin-antitoxin module